MVLRLSRSSRSLIGYPLRRISNQTRALHHLTNPNPNRKFVLFNPHETFLNDVFISVLPVDGSQRISPEKKFYFYPPKSEPLCPFGIIDVHRDFTPSSPDYWPRCVYGCGRPSSCHGLFCAGFGFDPLSKDYKVLMFVDNSDSLEYNEDDPCYEVCSLKTGSWRPVSNNPQPPSDDYSIFCDSVYIDGICYSLARDNSSRSLFGIVSFDFATEEFSWSRWRHVNDKCFWPRGFCLVEYEGLLGCVLFHEVEGMTKFHLLVRENESWSQVTSFRVPGACRPVACLGKDKWFFKGKNDELLFSKPVCIYDLPKYGEIIPFVESTIWPCAIRNKPDGGQSYYNQTVLCSQMDEPFNPIQPFSFVFSDDHVLVDSVGGVSSYCLVSHRYNDSSKVSNDLASGKPRSKRNDPLHSIPEDLNISHLVCKLHYYVDLQDIQVSQNYEKSSLTWSDRLRSGHFLAKVQTNYKAKVHQIDYKRDFRTALFRTCPKVGDILITPTAEGVVEELRASSVLAACQIRLSTSSRSLIGYPLRRIPNQTRALHHLTNPNANPKFVLFTPHKIFLNDVFISVLSVDGRPRITPEKNFYFEPPESEPSCPFGILTSIETSPRLLPIMGLNTFVVMDSANYCEDSNTVVVLNPLINEFKSLDCSPIRRRLLAECNSLVCAGFGFDTVSKDYKVLMHVDNIFSPKYNPDDPCYVVCSLKTGSWRPVSNNPQPPSDDSPSVYSIFCHSVYIDGISYSLALDHKSESLFGIVSFDFATEEFLWSRWRHVNDKCFWPRGFCLVEYEGLLGCVLFHEVEGTTKFHLLVRDNESWAQVTSFCVPGADRPVACLGKDKWFFKGKKDELLFFDPTAVDPKPVCIYDLPNYGEIIPFVESTIWPCAIRNKPDGERY
ncbi:F-box protein [Striga asiatica]|uniref:F-box protein n=1 Tax=Striga asiatica TaxID=4170 RepID=A0A5A7QM43_STRAF|nr:F-box protein [Striga asiatica]